MYPYRGGNNFNVYHSNRFVGFAGPFLLGALTGGVATAAFNPYRPRPVYGPVPMVGPMVPGFY